MNIPKFRLRNKISGLYYAKGQNFCATESQASVYQKGDASILVIKNSFENVEVEAVVPNRKFVVYTQLGHGTHGPVKFLKRMNGDLAVWTSDMAKARRYNTKQGARRIATMVSPAYVMAVDSQKWKACTTTTA